MANREGDLTLADILAWAGTAPNRDLAIVRHTFRAGGLQGPEDLTPERVLTYTREQGLRTGSAPTVFDAGTWLVFTPDGGPRARFFTAYDNLGEEESLRTAQFRYFNIRESSLLASLRARLVIEWGSARTWRRWGSAAIEFPVLEIADPTTVRFPGFDSVCVSYSELRMIVDDPRYHDWRVALESVKGIYLVADATGPGRLYVGKADGAFGILGRWSQYARDGHGGNVALRELATVDRQHAGNYTFSILRVFGKSVNPKEIDDAENHYKEALLTRRFGQNRN